MMFSDKSRIAPNTQLYSWLATDSMLKQTDTAGGSAVGGALITAFAPLYSWVYRRKGSVHRIDVGAACGGLELFCIQCVVSLGPAGRKKVRCV